MKQRGCYLARLFFLESIPTGKIDGCVLTPEGQGVAPASWRPYCSMPCAIL